MAHGNGEDRTRPIGVGLSGTNLERAGDHNQRVTLHAVRLNGPVQRTELADITGLTAPAIANITRRLLNDGLIMESGRHHGARGRAASKLVINPDSCFSIGVNVDRDHITIVVVDFVGRVRARSSREVAFAMPDAVQSFFRHSIGQMLAKANIDPARLIGIGVAFPDEMERTKLPEQPDDYAVWGSVAVDELLSDVFPIPVYVENDAAAAALGEMQFGLGHQYRSFFYILITAALGGGLVVDGQYVRGANGRSGELGWLHGRDAAGNSRQLQNIVSLSALYSLLAREGYHVASPRGLTRLDGRGRDIALGWVEASSETLVDTMLAINCLINPEAVLIGGRLPSTLVDRLADGLNRRLKPYAAQFPVIAPVARALTSDDAPAVGAAILPFSKQLLPRRSVLMKTAMEA
ncbi:MAG TPA: ROK family protein [Stellaceae bacterium]|nr:ROK family protein [Stellaceae bacterium]